MIPPTLVVLAAGLSSRFNTHAAPGERKDKQQEPFGPQGETLLDYSVFDARRAGFGKVVFVIRREGSEVFRDRMSARFAGKIAVDFAFQELADVPAGLTVPAARVKPWGTGHATWAAREVVNEPFGVINADDFYGRESFAKLAAFLQTPDLATAPARHGLVAFTLRNTLSEHGRVARGLCQTTPDGLLSSVEELTDLYRVDGAVENRPAGGPVRRLTGEEPVSLNTWGFSPSIFPDLERLFAAFLAERGGNPQAEFYLPFAIDELIRAGRERCRVLRSEASWFGVTYREDAPRVRAALRALHEAGEYPVALWE